MTHEDVGKKNGENYWSLSKMAVLVLIALKLQFLFLEEMVALKRAV